MPKMTSKSPTLPRPLHLLAFAGISPIWTNKLMLISVDSEPNYDLLISLNLCTLRQYPSVTFLAPSHLHRHLHLLHHFLFSHPITSSHLCSITFSCHFFFFFWSTIRSSVSASIVLQNSFPAGTKNNINKIINNNTNVNYEGHVGN